MNPKQVIVRVKGGLGNQLFGYAAGRRLARANQAELVIDDVTGFLRDYQYQRIYELDKFNIQARKATARERLEPLERYRRGFLKFVNLHKRFDKRGYLEQEDLDYDRRLLDYQVRRRVHLDGYWQSENYFKDVSQVIRKDLELVSKVDNANLRMAEKIRSCNAVSIHVRWFGDYNSGQVGHENNLDRDYYLKAVQIIKEKIPEPHFFVFSDDPGSAQEMLGLPNGLITIVDLNNQAEKAFLDLWLMTRCKHHIIANSTFSWWGAWLGEKESTFVVASSKKMTGVSAWGFKGLIPDRWILC
jgi:hypothetical protein